MKIKNSKTFTIKGILNKVYPLRSAISLNFYALFINKRSMFSMRKIHALVSFEEKVW